MFWCFFITGWPSIFSLLYFSKANTFLIMYNNLVRFEHIGPGRTSEGRDLPEVSLLRLCLSRSVRFSCVGYLCWRTWEKPTMQQDPSSQELGLSPGPCAASVCPLLGSPWTQSSRPLTVSKLSSPWEVTLKLFLYMKAFSSLLHQKFNLPSNEVFFFFLKRLLFRWKRIICGTGLVETLKGNH